MSKLIPINDPDKQLSTRIQEQAIEEQDYNDRQLSRMNQIDIINRAVEGIQELAEIAKQAQHPKHYEALARLIDSATNANKALMDIQVQRKELELELDKYINNYTEGPKTVTNNVVFNGTTRDFISALKKGLEENE